MLVHNRVNSSCLRDLGVSDLKVLVFVSKRIAMVGVTEIVAILATCVVSLYFYFKISFKYWEKRNVPHIKPQFPWGTNGNPLRPEKGIQELFKNFYDEFKSQGQSFGGLYLFTKPAVLVISPEMVKNVLTKDFQYFTGHGIHVDEEKEPFSGNLFSLDGEKWKNMRVKLTPTFTSGKMKMMFQAILACSDPMVEHVNDLCAARKPMDVKEVLACFTTDVIGSCAFGVECNSFKDPNAEFRAHGREVFQATAKSNFYRILNLIIPRLRLTAFGGETKAFFYDIFTKIVKERETNNYKRNDFVQLMLELKEKGDGLTLGQMLAQSFMFFAAGFETSSTTMTFCLHELSWHLDIQERLRKEINETMKKYDGKLTYDGIMEMKYLDMVLEGEYFLSSWCLVNC